MHVMHSFEAGMAGTGIATGIGTRATAYMAAHVHIARALCYPVLY